MFDEHIKHTHLIYIINRGFFSVKLRIVFFKISASQTSINSYSFPMLHTLFSESVVYFAFHFSSINGEMKPKKATINSSEKVYIRADFSKYCKT